MISLSGNWKIEYTSGGVRHEGSLYLPGTMQAAGYGDPVTEETEFVTSLHDPDWFLWDEFKSEGDEVNVPFLSKPRRHFIGVCTYTRSFEVLPEQAGKKLFFFAELIRRRSAVYVDGEYKGSYESACAPHVVSLGVLEQGSHDLRVEVDNGLFPGFRPDAHSVTDGVGASWNGIVGTIELFSREELYDRIDIFKKYAEEHPRTAITEDGYFVIDGKKEYIRATHFGGDFPKTGFPSTDKEEYITVFERLKDWGFNAVRCHSYCPVEAMFRAADECGIFLLVECGMWSTFYEGAPVLDYLYLETEAILRAFGHHPSFVFFSPSNEPGGNWYQVLRDWVSFARKTDEKLGYGGRRLYTAQSGWFYDTAPSETEGTDFLYFHRSAYGPLRGGTVRNPAGWNGKDYSPSLEGVKLPVICHELGQWCAYPDFKVADRFTGFLKPSNYRAFENLAKKNGIYDHTQEMHISSGKNQLRLLKEEFEANYRTPGLKGYEYLDVHDYPGQGTAFVGIFDAFFEPKAYADRDYFRQFNSEDVLTAAFKTYTVIQGAELDVPVRLSHYSDALGTRFSVKAELIGDGEVIWVEETDFDTPERGSKISLGDFHISIPESGRPQLLTYKLTLTGGYYNSWELFSVPKDVSESEDPETGEGSCVVCRSFNDVFELLDSGKDVLFLPALSELNYDSPSVNGRSVFWNAQMGPKWERSLGISIDSACGFFNYFPSKMSGGRQWDSVLRAGRGMIIPGDLKPTVRVIDDWNRSIPMAFLLEARVSKGRLLMSAFDEKAFDAPETGLYFRALKKYMASADFDPSQELSKEDLLKMYFPVNRMKSLTESVNCTAGDDPQNIDAMVLSNPHLITLARGKEVTFEIKLKRPVKIQGFVWLNNQRNRMRDDFAKEIRITLHAGEKTVDESFSLKNTVREQRIMLKAPVTADTVTLTVFDTFGREIKPMYVETPTGFEKRRVKKENKVGIAAFHVITDEYVAGDNERFWEKGDEVLTKEIDT